MPDMRAPRLIPYDRDSDSEGCQLSIGQGQQFPSNTGEAHVPVPRPTSELHSERKLFLYGLPSGLDSRAIRNAIVSTVEACEIPLIDHLKCLEVNKSLGTCIFHFDRFSWAAAAFSYFTSGGRLNRLQKTLGGVDLNITFNSRLGGFFGDDSVTQKSCQIALDNLPPQATDWDIFKRLMLEPACDLVPLIVRKTDRQRAIATFLRREHVLLAVFRLSREPLVVDGTPSDVHWVQSLNESHSQI